jgi:hypothetical protein
MSQQPQPVPRFPSGSPTFQVHKDQQETPEQLEAKISDMRIKANELRQAELKKQEMQRVEQENAKFKKLETLKETLETLNMVNGLGSKLSLTDAMDLAEEKRKVISQIEQIEDELGFTSISCLPEAKKNFGLSSSKALWTIGGLTLLSFLLFWIMGTAAVSDDPLNDSARRMMNSVGLRVMTNFLPFSIAILAAVGFIWLLFPSVFGYWHSKVSTNFSLISDLEQCDPSHRVAFFAFSYGLPVWAFVQLMQVIFG